MPPSVKYSREQVLRAAMRIVEENGVASLTARRVASQLGCSTAPVYRQFATMDELAVAVVKEAQERLLEYASRPYTERVFLNMGTGIAMFACEHRRLYRALLLEGDSYSDVVSEILDILEFRMTKDSRFKSLSKRERRVLLTKMWTFTHGLASLICVGLVKQCDQDYVIKTLLDVGGDIIGATLAKQKRPSRHQ